MLQYLVLCVIFLTFPAVCLIREIRFLCRTRNCHVRVDGKIVRMEEKLLAGDEDAFDDFVNDQVTRVVNGKEIN